MKTGICGRFIATGLILFLPLVCFGQAPVQKPGETVKDVTPLVYGQTIERQIPPGQKHFYKLRLDAGQFAAIEADQRGCDVVFSLYSPEGQNQLEFTNVTEGDGVERVPVAVEKAGEYELRVMSMHTESNSGTYFLKIAEMRTATQKEMSLTTGNRLFNEAFNITRENATADAINAGIAKFNQAAEKFHFSGALKREGIVLRNIGDLYDRLGDRTKGVELKRSAMERFRAVDFKYGEFWVHRDLGNAYLELGEIERSLDHFLKAIDLFSVIEHSGNRAETMNSIGKLYERIGDRPRSAVYYTQALAIAKVEEGAFSIHIGIANNNLGQIYLLAGDVQKARGYFQTALDIARASNNRLKEAAFLINLSKTYGRPLEGVKALELLQMALTIGRTMGNRLSEAAALKSIGQYYLALGESAFSLEFLNQALAIYRSVEDSQNLAETLLTVARAEAHDGDLDKAQAAAEEAIALIETVRGRFNVADLRDSYSANLQDYYSFYVDLLMRRHALDPAKNFAALALQINERGRARGLINLLVESNANIREGAPAALLHKETGLRNLLAARLTNLTKLLNARSKPGDVDELKIEIEQIRVAYDQTQAQIRQTSPRYSDLTQPKMLDIAQIQAKVVDDDSVLLEYALGESRSYLWIVTREKMISVELPSKRVIETAARRFYDTLTARNKEIKFETDQERDTRIEKADLARPVYSAALSQMIIGPAAPFLSNKRILIVADGALQYVPFAALAGAGNRYLVETNEIVSLPSASVLSILRRETDARRLPSKTLAVLADPIFEKSDERFQEAIGKSKTKTPIEPAVGARQQTRGAAGALTRDDLELSRLPYTRREADLITSMVPAKQREKLLDFAASRRAAMSPELANYRYVHFATHGIVNNENPELSGIALSMFDATGVGQDGFLRVGDIYNLKLPAEMVVLSGCKTGLGKEIRGEGLVGLTRGFIYAGAKRVTVSLWDVNDEATADLMGRFYREMLGPSHLAPAAGLRQAQISMIGDKRWENPYYWATFVLAGEPK